MNLKTRDEIFSAMVVYGFLSYEGGKVYIPNHELMKRFVDMLQKERSLGYVHRLAIVSERMLKATLSGDTDTMEEILSYAHNTEVPLENQAKLRSTAAGFWQSASAMINPQKSTVAKLTYSHKHMYHHIALL